MNCELLKALFKNQNVIKIRKNREAKKFLGEIAIYLSDKVLGIFGTSSIDQKVVDNLQTDIKYNRQLIKNQSMILHEIVQVQNMSINEIAREIVTLKYDVMKIENWK